MGAAAGGHDPGQRGGRPVAMCDEASTPHIHILEPLPQIFLYCLVYNSHMSLCFLAAKAAPISRNVRLLVS